MRKQRNNKGQAMVEYIILVVLIAIALIVLFGKLAKGIGKNVAVAAEALDERANTDEALKELDGNTIRKIQVDDVTRD